MIWGAKRVIRNQGIWVTWHKLTLGSRSSVTGQPSKSYVEYNIKSVVGNPIQRTYITDGGPVTEETREITVVDSLSINDRIEIPKDSNVLYVVNDAPAAITDLRGNITHYITRVTRLELDN